MVTYLLVNWEKLWPSLESPSQNLKCVWCIRNSRQKYYLVFECLRFWGSRFCLQIMHADGTRFCYFRIGNNTSTAFPVLFKCVVFQVNEMIREADKNNDGQIDYKGRFGKRRWHDFLQICWKHWDMHELVSHVSWRHESAGTKTRFLKFNRDKFSSASLQERDTFFRIFCSLKKPPSNSRMRDKGQAVFARRTCLCQA